MMILWAVSLYSPAAFALGPLLMHGGRSFTTWPASGPDLVVRCGYGCVSSGRRIARC